MNNIVKILALASVITPIMSISASAAKKPEVKQKTIVVDASQPKAPIQKTMYGIFFEDINFAADGGLYAEMIKNRSFEFENPFQGWKVNGGVTLKEDGPFENNPHYLHMETIHRSMPAIIENEGFFGIGIEEGHSYTLTFYARGKNYSAITYSIIDPASWSDNQDVISGKVDIENDSWHKYTLHFVAPKTVEKSHLRLVVWSGCVDIEHVSLFPDDTFNGHKNGLRNDIAQALADLHPGILRFPGGCIVEGATVPMRYKWKNTVGPVENRIGEANRWAGAMGGRYFPDYYQSYGLGFFEYFQFAEEIGAEPLPVLSVGMACQFQNPDDASVHTPVDSLDFLIQDALDLIEFANGENTTEWGAVREEMGHPEPFNLKYIAIGNENWTRGYAQRLARFVEAIRREYPEIKIVGSAGAAPSGDEFDTLWKEMRALGVDLVDEHFYMDEDFFLSSANRYDSYDRSSATKVFAGEYACHTKGMKFNNYQAALMEAALMTGYERNADVVSMTAYAPLLAHKEGWQWRPDLLWYTNLRTIPTSSYYVQQMYATHRGTSVLDCTLEGYPAAGKYGQDQIFASAVIDEDNNQYIIKLVNAYKDPQKIEFSIKNMPKGYKANTASAVILHSDVMDADEAYVERCAVPVENVVDKGFKKSSHGAKITAVVEPGTFVIYTVDFTVKTKKR